MTATVAQGKDEDYYDQEEVKQEKTKKGRKDIENYLSEEGHNLGFFYGLGINEIGLLNGHTEKGDLRKLLRGIHPRTGEQMFTPRKSKSHFTDICFSAPKDFSIIAELDEDNRDKYEALQLRAVKRALDKLQPKLYRRKNSKNEKEFQMKPIHLLYNHKTSRPLEDRRPDMQWHTHAPTLKMALGQNNEWYALDNYPMFNNQKLLGAEYRAEIANGLREMGYEIIPTIEEVEEEGTFKRVKVSSFKIRQITQEQRDMFSGRSLEIRERSKPGATSIDRYNTAQNIKRVKVQWDDTELKAVWKKDAESVGLTYKKIQEMKTFNKEPTLIYSKTIEEIIRSAAVKGKLYESLLRLRLTENEQQSGINADNLFNYLEETKVITRIKGFEFSTTVDLNKAKRTQRIWKNKIKYDKKDAWVKFNKFKDSVNSAKSIRIDSQPAPVISKMLIDDKSSVKPMTALVSKNKTVKRVSSVLPATSNLGTIESLGRTLGNLQAKLFDITISEDEKNRIQEEIRKIQAEIEALKKQELNKKQKPL